MHSTLVNHVVLNLLTETQNSVNIFIISQDLDGVRCWKLTLWKTKTRLSSVDNNLVKHGLVSGAARVPVFNYAPAIFRFRHQTVKNGAGALSHPQKLHANIYVNASYIYGFEGTGLQGPW